VTSTGTLHSAVVLLRRCRLRRWEEACYLRGEADSLRGEAFRRHQRRVGQTPREPTVRELPKAREEAWLSTEESVVGANAFN
jgi:hypothetical protein